jgi:hypothetical protein
MGKLAILAGVAMTRLPESVVRMIYRGREERLGKRVLDPKAQAVGRLANLLRQPGQVPSVEESRAQTHRIAKAFDEPSPPLKRKQDIEIDGAASRLKARIYCDRPKSDAGNLAAVVSQQADGPAPFFQVLIYPGLDGRMQSKSIQQLRDAYIIPLDRTMWYLKTYLGGFDDPTDPRFSPGIIDDVSGLPPTYMVTGGFDPLRDEGTAYAERLAAAGVPTVHRHFPGQIHAFVSLTKVIPQGNQCIREIADWLKRI